MEKITAEMWRLQCVLYAAVGGEFEVPAVFSRWTQQESTSIENLMEHKAFTECQEAPEGGLILYWDTNSEESILLTQLTSKTH